jgi:ABC-type dipeptide/oligopeptide/nickel transport system permease component
MCLATATGDNLRRYIVHRLLLIPVVLLGIVTVAFAITHLVPSNPLSSVLSERQLGNPEAVAAATHKYGLDKPLPTQYFIYVKKLLSGDAGTSFVTKQSVTADLGKRLPATLELTFVSMIIAIVGGVLIGVLVATRHNKLTDHAGRLFSLIGSSVPVYWSGLVLLLIFSVKLGWLPGPGRLDSRSAKPADVTGFYTIDALLDGNLAKFWEALRHLVLPASVLGWGVMGTVSRIVRASMLDVLGQDYVRTARAKGARESTVVFRHALRNALIPAMTIVGFSVAYLLTGAVLVESIFSWPGIGSYSVKAAQTLDFPAIMGVCLLGGLAFLVANFVTDLGYALADPRIRLS